MSVEVLVPEHTVGLKAGTAKRYRGKRQVRSILDEARSILIGEGYAGLTLRKVAKNLDISLGNLTYYFPSKIELLKAIIVDLLTEYERALAAEQKNFPDDVHGRFRAWIRYLVADCKKADTRSVFFQIWGLATHSDIVSELRDDMYRAARDEHLAMISALNPNASEDDINALVGLVITMIEGFHVVADLGDGALQLPTDYDDRLCETIYQVVLGACQPSSR